MLAVLALGSGKVLLTFAALCIVLPVCVALFAFWLWMLVSAIQNKGLDEGEKIGWVIVIALLHLLGALLYFFIGHPKRQYAGRAGLKSYGGG